MGNTPHPLVSSWTSPVEVVNQRCSSIEQDVRGNRKHTEQFDRMTKIVQLIEMGGLKGVAKRSLLEKTSSPTGKQGEGMAGAGAGAEQSRKSRAGAGAFPSGLLVCWSGLLAFRLSV